MKNDIKIIALDLDGTLLDSQKRLSEANRAALEEAAAKGVHIVPTTGRFFGMMPQAVRDLPFVRYAITINGAQVYDRETDTAIVREEIPLDMALDIIRLLEGYDVIYDCYRSN
jgi:HAD superfamily hydrolase (TIGR01484 family)